jgi:hypothetical protein
MITFEKLNIRKKRSNSKIVAFSVFVTVMFACLFLLQERTYAVACYTDTWADDSGVSEQVYFEGEEIDGPYIVGSGVTHIEYFEPYHEASVVTTLTSPSGQQTTAYDSEWWGYYKQPFTARAEVELLWNENEVGTYTINSEHSSYCPEANFGSTNASLPVSIKREVYVLIGDIPTGGRFGYGYCEYDNYCPFGLGICGLSYFTVERYNANAVCSGTIQCRTLYVRGTCLNRAKVCTGIPPNTGTCDYN